MTSLLTRTLALLASLQSAVGLALPSAEDKAVNTVKRANGPVNAVYFTNWFGNTLSSMFQVSNLLIGVYTAATTSLLTFQFLRFPIFFILF